jgi:hypothetical protein
MPSCFIDYEQQQPPNLYWTYGILGDRLQVNRGLNTSLLVHDQKVDWVTELASNCSVKQRSSAEFFE